MVYYRKRNNAARRIQRRFRARRRPKTAVAKLARRVNQIAARSPPAEIKFIDTDIGQSPTVTTPTLKVLATPDTQGTAMNQRVGAKVSFMHISGKLRVLKKNYGDKRASATVVGYVIWLKNADYASDFEANFAKEILNEDQNGEFSPLSYFNRQRYGSWIATNKFKVTLRDQIPLAQAAMGLTSAIGDPPEWPSTTIGSNTLLGKTPQTQFKYVTFNKRLKVDAEWQNKYTVGADETKLTRMKPYLFCYTDCVGQSSPSGGSVPLGDANDSVGVQGTIRLSYADA